MGLAGPRATLYASITAILTWLIALMTALRGWPLPSRRPRILFLLLYSMVILSITLIMTPNLAQSFYWGQGMRSVVPPLIIATLFLGLMQWNRVNLPRLTYIKLVAAGGASFIAGGFSETYVCVQTVALVATCAIAISRKTPIGKSILSMLLVALFFSIISLAIISIAPGNHVRAQYFPPPPDFSSLLYIAGANMTHFLKMLLLSPGNILCLLGLLGFSLLISREGAEMIPKSFLERHSRYALTMIPILAIGLLYASFLPAAYGMSGSPPERTLIIPVFLIVFSLAVWGNALGQVIKGCKMSSFAGHLFFAYAPKIALASLLVLTIAKTNLAIQSQSVQANFAVNWDQVVRLIWQAKKDGKKSIEIEHVSNLVGLEDIGNDPKHWINQCASDYYGISVVTK